MVKGEKTLHIQVCQYLGIFPISNVNNYFIIH